MTDEAAFQLNGAQVALAGTDPRESLLRWLNRQGRTGTKEGCGDGDCGACTVAMVVRGADGRARYQAVNACLLPMGAMVGREIVTVEALAASPTALHPVQQAMVDCGGSQCGYCTPGFVMSLFAGYYAGVLDDGTIEGNLCRCTGYLPIRRAAGQLRTSPPAADDRFASDLARPRTALPAGGLAAFHSPTSIADALALKLAHPEAAWIAGATDLGVALSRGQATATAYIALDRIAALEEIEIGESHVRIGAGVTLEAYEAVAHGIFPALDAMLPWFAGRQVRNRATFGGNLGTASPIGDLLPVLLALDAGIELRGPGGSRTLPLDGYFTGYRTTLRDAHELIVSITLPRRPDLIQASAKVAKRQTDDISIVAAAFALALDDQRRVRHVRLAYGGVAAIPLRAKAIEAMLLGSVLDHGAVEAARIALEAAFEPLDDHRASAAYRRALCGSLFAKFVEEHVP